MARVTYVKKAQQRYATVPVLDADGKQVTVAMIDKRTGQPKVTKTGRAVTMRLTREDKSQPLPNRTCGNCRKEIVPGSPYKWIKPKSGPYGGRMMVRCAECPTWQVWDYSSSLSARTAKISHDFSQAIEGVESADDVQSALDDAAGAVREIAEEKREGASNIEEGFGHATSQSEELEQIADDLDAWADEIESADVPDLDDDEYALDCDTCDGTGNVENPDYDADEAAKADETGEAYEEEEEIDCDECGGTGQDENRDRDAWREAVQEACSIVDECPV